MIIFGVDPGTAITGFGIISVAAEKVKLIDFGCITTEAGKDMEKRLLLLHKELKKILREQRPDVVVIERLFFNSNVKTAMAVGQARGVIMLTVAECRVPIVEYTALQAKQVLTGYGRADKKQVEIAVKKKLRIKRPIRPDDAADALAVALCHHNKMDQTNVV